MRNYGLITPCYAADTSGVCSMLYELGGMIVVHDASGCNSTYTTHDEPRWTLSKSMIYISAFTELDAVMGNDEKLISDICAAAKDQNPRFIAICGSPMPMMTGVDFDAIATETELHSGIQTLGLHTTGTHSYIDGASEALLAYVKRNVPYSSDKIKDGINILGATPLDFGVNSTIMSIQAWLSECGFTPVSCLAMGTLAGNIANAGKARANLVISQTGIAAAEYMKKQLGIPYLCGVPVGKQYAAMLSRNLRQILSGQEAEPFRRNDKPDTVIIGEAVFSASLANALSLDSGVPASVISPLPAEKDILSPADTLLNAEEEIERELRRTVPKTVIADPLYKPLIPAGTARIELPHFAFSGRCFANRIPDLINRNIEEIIHD